MPQYGNPPPRQFRGGKEWVGVETILQTLELVPEYLRLIGLTDLLDMAIIAFGIYHLFRFVRRSRSGQVVKAILFIVVAMALANLPQLHLRVVRTVLNNAVELGCHRPYYPVSARAAPVFGADGQRQDQGAVCGGELQQRPGDAVKETVEAYTSLSKDKVGGR